MDLGLIEQRSMDALAIGDWDVFLLAGGILLEQTAIDTLFPACRKAGTSIICGGLLIQVFSLGAIVGVVQRPQGHDR